MTQFRSLFFVVIFFPLIFQTGCGSGKDKNGAKGGTMTRGQQSPENETIALNEAQTQLRDAGLVFKLDPNTGSYSFDTFARQGRERDAEVNSQKTTLYKSWIELLDRFVERGERYYNSYNNSPVLDRSAADDLRKKVALSKDTRGVLASYTSDVPATKPLPPTDHTDNNVPYQPNDPHNNDEYTKAHDELMQAERRLGNVGLFFIYKGSQVGWNQEVWNSYLYANGDQSLASIHSKVTATLQQLYKYRAMVKGFLKSYDNSGFIDSGEVEITQIKLELVSDTIGKLRDWLKSVEDHE